VNSILEKYIVDTEDVFEDIYESKNDPVKQALADLLDKLPNIKSEEWTEIFSRMNSNSMGAKINTIEAYIVATSKIINGYAVRNKYLFANNQRDISFFNSIFWSKINHPLLKEFLKAVANKIGIPEYIASSVRFINKLHKQFIQDIYFEKTTDKSSTFINLQNGTLSIGQSGIKLEEHHPKYFLQYICDYEYSKNAKTDDYLDVVKCHIPSIYVQNTLQQSISQVLVKNFDNGRKICLYGLSKNITDDFINMLKEVIPNDLIQDYFKNDNAKLEDLFVNFKDISKDKQSLEKITFISFEYFSEDNLPKNICTNKSAVLNWLINGAREIIKYQQVYIAQECEDFKERFNLVNLFVSKTNLIKTKKHSKSIVTSYENVYREYESFCELQDEDVLTKTKFNRELKSLGFESTRREVGNVWFAKFA